MKFLRLACSIALVFSAIALTAQSPYPRDPAPQYPQDSASGRDGFFSVPMIGRNRVDRCLHWGMQCDQPAADQFCRQQGFARAASFNTRLARPTLVMGENEICNRADCAALENVRCVRDDLRPSNNYPPHDNYDRSRDGRDGFFAMPMIDRTRVDWCLHWGVECGRPAADNFCQQQGFRRAEDFSYRPARPTLVMGDRQVCNRADCQALENVRCGSDREPPRRDLDRPAPPGGARTFQSPTVRGQALDRCLYRGRECDQPAADQFCSMQGFRRAVDFAITPFSPTLVLGENSVCRVGCHAFSQITCSNH